MLKFLRKPKFLIPFLIIIIGATLALSLRSDNAPRAEFTEAIREDLIQELSVTGRVKSSESVELAFEKIGKISKVYVKVGDKVETGDSLVTLDDTDLAAELARVRASAKSEEAKLDELFSGTRPEEISIQKVKVASAKVSLDEAKKNLADKIGDAYTKSDDAIRNKVDQFFSNPKTAPQLMFVNSGSPEEIEVESRRAQIENTLSDWETFLNFSGSIDQIIYSGETAKTNLMEIKIFLDKVSKFINGLASNSSISQTTIDGWKTDVSAARTNVNSAISNISAAEEKLSSAESTLTLAEEELALKIAGATPEEILAQEARVDEAHANIQSTLAQLLKTTIRSPIDGVVVKQAGKVGEVVSANINIVSVISAANFEIEVNIPEADIAKLEPGDLARITLDAYTEDDIFEARVAVIDPAETIIEGVPVYKTTLEFTKDDSRIRSGMTANIDIITDKKLDVIAIPQRAIIRRNGDKIVRLLEGEKVNEVKVTIGITGVNGDIEVTSGIKEGDKIITFLEEK